jgi:hypothetical protein
MPARSITSIPPRWSSRTISIRCRRSGPDGGAGRGQGRGGHGRGSRHRARHRVASGQGRRRRDCGRCRRPGRNRPLCAGHARTVGARPCRDRGSRAARRCLYGRHERRPGAAGGNRPRGGGPRRPRSVGTPCSIRGSRSSDDALAQHPDWGVGGTRARSCAASVRPKLDPADRCPWLSRVRSRGDLRATAHALRSDQAKRQRASSRRASRIFSAPTNSGGTCSPG